MPKHLCTHHIMHHLQDNMVKDCVCFSLMSLDLLLALLFDFAQECKRLSVGGFDVSLFSPIS